MPFCSTRQCGIMALYLGLVHYPVYNKNEQTIASAVTTVDLHDLSRCARTYGARKLLVITPLQDQQKLVERVCIHWTRGFGASYNPYRKEAIELVSVASSLKEAVEFIVAVEGESPFVVATDAGPLQENAISFSAVRTMILKDHLVFLIFGTAWGLHEEILTQSNAVLPPVLGTGDYNHLSVRSASAIILDRLVGTHPNRMP